MKTLFDTPQKKQVVNKGNDFDNHSYIKIPLNGHSLDSLRISIGEEVYDIDSWNDHGSSGNITTTILTAEKDWENWITRDSWSNTYTYDDKELVKKMSPTYVELMSSLTPFPAVYKLDNGDYDVFIRIDTKDSFGYSGHVIESNEPKNYPVGRYSVRWNLKNMSKVDNYGK